MATLKNRGIFSPGDDIGHGQAMASPKNRGYSGHGQAMATLKNRGIFSPGDDIGHDQAMASLKNRG
ncbi:uncharacterized protein BDCG_08834 [Blastomyces dermatitidis ER-3]|uniref:Uncharacterized protein n=1 Tax=Ajellomyces dermatitidis (strain ER-3 / ATCC MYA-2586) TaxID=559297 RepID=A0ABP2ESH8_AJEDR|nr:uncharacterized protein BDCG_08834 [Blastomyces dermatitidis ER-3]EEQ85565.2 hypothetical protein BDCG_08834 [Blastomyces dermatitidis ER-3]EQL29757.1 hypothetical protein BDFG_07651 [Blastomyces dermatitidis ATCC 26199]